MAINLIQTAHAAQIPFRDRSRFRQGLGVRRCIVFYAHHRTLGSPWEGFIPMESRAAEMRDFRLPHKRTVHQHLSQIVKNLDHIMECIQTASLSDKRSFVTKNGRQREKKLQLRSKC